jgi:hypothetical protein
MEVNKMDNEKNISAGENKEGLHRFVNFANKLIGNVSVTNQDFFTDSGFSMSSRTKKTIQYTKDEAAEIIRAGDSDSLKELSESFFYSSGFYRRLIMYYSTILYYIPLLIPHMVKDKKKITDKKYSEKYFEALELINSLNFEQLCRHFTQKVLVEGAYYGMIKEVDGEYSIQDLPFDYCRSRLKSFTGVDIVEFDVTWFDQISDDRLKLETLKTFPKEVRRWYLKYTKGTEKSSWVRLPMDKGIHFTLVEERPFFSSVIPSIIHFSDYIDMEEQKDLQQLHVLLAQELDHTSTGELIFEPEEAVEFHKGLTAITKKNEFLDGITTYGKLKAVRILDDDAASTDNLEKVSKVLYTESGVSKQIFSADGNNSLERSIQNDIALMMALATKFSIWLKNFINSIIADKYITFGVEILPVGQYNVKDYQAQALNAAQYGYSFIIPSIAMGLEQNQLFDIKSVETKVLKMHELLVPLQSSHTMSDKNKSNSSTSSKLTEEEQKQAEKEGASKAEEDRSEKTIQNRETSGGED